MSEQELIDFYLANGDLFTQNDVVSGALRTIGFWIVKGLAFVGDACKQLYDITFGLVDFTTWPKINDFVDKFQPVFVALMAASLVALGVMLIANHEKKPKLALNICIACLCVTCSTLVFTQLNTLVKAAKTDIEGVNTESTADVYDIVGNNTLDICYLDQRLGMSNIDYEKNQNKLAHASMTKQKMSVIDYNEVLDPDSDRYDFTDDNAKDILSSELVSLGDGENYKIDEVYNGVLWTSAGNNFYYRYKIDMLPVMLELIALVVLYVAMAYKCTRLAFELVFGRLLAYLYSAELSGGQKIAKIMVFIRDTYILLFMTTLCIKLFYFFTAYIGELNTSPLIEAALICFIAFSVIDGPNLVEKLLGMDAGLKSSTTRLLAASRMANSVLHKAGRTASAPLRAAERSRERSRQAEAAGRTIRNAMSQGAGAAPETMDMHTEGRGKTDKDGEGNADRSGGASAESADREAFAAGANAQQQMKDTRDKHAAADESFDTASFMDKGASDGDFSHDEPKDMSLEESMPGTAFMDDAASEGKPIGQMDGSAPEDGGQQAAFMSDSEGSEDAESERKPKAAESAETSSKNREVEQNMAGKGEKADDRKGKAHPQAKEAPSGGKKQMPDRFEQMMAEQEKPGRQKSSLNENRVIAQYKGKIFDRNMRKDDKR